VLLGLAGALGWLLLRYSPDLLEIFISTSAAGGIRFHLSISTFLLFYVMLFAADVLLILILLLTFVLLKLGILNYTAVGRSRRVLVPLLLLLSAMITPPDPATMIIVFLPLRVRFEISLFIFRVFA
jgi:sec-independent protein translocase protein TatC